MTLVSEMTAFVTSDVGPAACAVLRGKLQEWGSNSLAHFSIGVVLGVLHLNLRFCDKCLLLFAFFLIAKEIFFDIPLAGFAAVVILDSLWDVACYLLGYLLVLWSIMVSPPERVRS